ncbi:MAG: hypothetical protein Q8N18_12105 [Opitutaceae bacterium]|nr:hypothetical protein [Opitutaceae bacterium]
MQLILLIMLLALPAVAACAADPRGNDTFTVTPAGTGEQLVRTSLPLPRGLLREGQTFSVTDGKRELPAAVRPLSWYPVTNGEAKSVRRALVTFPYWFPTPSPVIFSVRAVAAERTPARALPVTATLRDETVALTWKNGERVELILLAPARTSKAAPRLEVVEDNDAYCWQRWHFPDPQWPRIIELRRDALGVVVLVAHLQRGVTNDHFVPELGWELTTFVKGVGWRSGETLQATTNQPLRHAFATGADATYLLADQFSIYHPTAPLKRRGEIEIVPNEKGSWTYRYLRCRAGDKVPMQPMSWQRAEIVIAPSGLARLTSSLASPHRVEPERKLWSALYGKLDPVPSLPPSLDALVRYHRDAIVQSAAVGDDFGNVTSYNGALGVADTLHVVVGDPFGNVNVYNHGAAHGGVFGVNRLNSGAAIFAGGRRGNDRRLTETALLWCDNFFDQTIWWGEKERGGTRYMDASRQNRTKPDEKYMWRSDTSVDFCTKGFDCFWLAWEETGDPRMLDAFRAQTAYAAQFVHADHRGGQCRNIGVVRDFIRLYQFTGERHYLDEALRLFRELRTQLSTGHLFDQRGKPLNPDPPFIEEDKAGYKVGYAKPYIIGYALAGLPELIPFAPDEPDLTETVRAVADFLAATVDPAGGWRYPHPRSSGVMVWLGVEHAWQLTQAARALGPEPKWLDAIETVLRARILGWQRTGMIFSNLEGWETSTGKVRTRSELYDLHQKSGDPDRVHVAGEQPDSELYDLYQKPGDRDAARDYREGRVSYGEAEPEGIVHFEEVLGYYLQHRPVARLLAAPKPDEPLGLILARSPEKEK